MEASTPLSIGEVAKRTGVRTSAIRYYESVGLLPAPSRCSGQRRYDPTVLHRMALIRFAQDAGFTLAEICTLFEGFADDVAMSSRWQALARQKLVEVDALISRAAQMKRLLGNALRCHCLHAEECAENIAAVRTSDASADGCGRSG